MAVLKCSVVWELTLSINSFVDRVFRTLEVLTINMTTTVCLSSSLGLPVTLVNREKAQRLHVKECGIIGKFIHSPTSHLIRTPPLDAGSFLNLERKTLTTGWERLDRSVTMVWACEKSETMTVRKLIMRFPTIRTPNLYESLFKIKIFCLRVITHLRVKHLPQSFLSIANCLRQDFTTKWHFHFEQS